MAVIQSAGSLVSTHRETLRPHVARSIEIYSGRVQDYAELYRAQPNLRLVIRFLARNIASLGLKAYRRKTATDREELEAGHPLRDFLKNPVPMATVQHGRHHWIRGLVEDLALYDVLFVLKARNEASGRLNGIRIPPPMIAPGGESWLWPEKFTLRGNRGEKDYAPGDVIYLHGHNPEDPKDGISPAESLRRILAEEAAAGEWREQLWKGAARMSGYLTRPVEAPKWSDPARTRFEEGWRSSWTGPFASDAGGTPILEEGMTFHEASFSAHDSEYVLGRRLAREECAAAYFIPPVFVGILEHANFANIKEQHVSLYADTLGPWLDWITEELEVQLVPEFPDVDDVYLEFNIEEKLRGRFEDQASTLQTATGAPWLLRSEARARMNLPEVPGLDQPIVPLNVLVGGQASPTDSAPPEPGELARPRFAHRRGAKALPRYLTGWEAKHVEVLNDFFLRQSSSVLSRLGAGQEVAAAFDATRWDGELSTDLFAVALAMAEDVGGAVAEDFGAEFDPALVEGWLAENARIAAEGINQATYEALVAAGSGIPRTGELARPKVAGLDDVDAVTEDTAEDALADVFSLALTVRVAQIATSRATSIGQWSRLEGAGQAGVRSKTWNVNSTSSRHADLDGQTVALGETFSNGAQWPGDPSLGVDETAGCLCSLTFGVEDPA